MDEFQINFNYEGVYYAGLVSPVQNGNTTSYKINLESENQESFVEITAKPSTSSSEDWDFECSNGENPANYYSKELLREIGEAIEKKLIS